MSTNFEELTENKITSKTTTSSKTRKKSTTKKSSSKTTAKSRKKVVNEDIIQVNKEQTQVIEVPTMEETKRSLSAPAISTSTVNKIDLTPVQKKRTIKNIKPSKKEIEPEVIIKEKTKKISAPIAKTTTKKSNKPKRTLRLNLGNDEIRNVDTSINQNASFFYEPSVFEKYNINFTDVDNETEQPLEIVIESIDVTSNNDVIENVEDVIENIATTENSLSTQETNSDKNDIDFSEFENEIIIEIEKEILNEQTNNIEIANTETVVSNETVENEITENVSSVETIENENAENVSSDETIENEITENISSDETIENEITENISSDETIENEITENISSDETIENEITENVSSVETIELENIETLDDTQTEKLDSHEELSVEPTNNDSSDETIITEQPINEITDTLIETDETNEQFTTKITSDDASKEEYKEAADSKNKIEKFWNSSIPSISSTNINTTFSKIKNSIVSNISPIFKKFTYEQANLLRNIDNDSNETIQNTISTVTTAFGDSNNLNSTLTQIEEPNELNINADEIVQIEIPSVNTETPEIDTMELSENDIYNVIIAESEQNTITQKTDEEVEEIIKNNKKLNKANKKQVVENILEEDESDFQNSDSDTEMIDEQNQEIDSYNEYDTFDDLPYPQIKNENVDDYNDDTFSIESYFGLDKLTDKDFESSKPKRKSSKKEKAETSKNTEANIVSTNETENKKSTKRKNSKYDSTDFADTPTIASLIESFNATLTTLSDRISTLEDNTTQTEDDVKTETTTSNQEPDIEDTTLIDSDKIDESELEDLLLNDSDLTDLIDDNALLNAELENDVINSTSELQDIKENENDNTTVENILSETLSIDNTNNDEIKDMFKNELLAGLTSTDDQSDDSEITTENSNDFLKVIDCLSKAISELENTSSAEQSSEDNNLYNANISPEISTNKSKRKSKKAKQENQSDLPSELLSADEVIEEGKSINILINKDDIFSISILNETYEIVADFDGISVLSENIHISTPKNNFFVKIGNKYIEIHNHKTHFIVHTNFEDVEFANAINNVGFAKKNNKIELNIKEAFKLASVNNKIELSMLNKTIASIKDTPVTQIDESSICDNKTLLISEETQKVYLPYTISEVMQKLKYSDEYQTVQEVVDNEYTVPLSTFKMPIISRFKEAYRFMRVKENSSVYAAVDLAVELMFNSNLNPAVIRAAKDLKELNIYLDCLYENEIEKFDCFKIIYKVLPKIK